MVVYDPFYCQGGIRNLYEKIGITNFIHEKRDFYADVEAKRVPDYDILITNPPYSQDHKEKIIAFVADSGKAWALLMPNYVANKSYFLDQVSSMGSSRESVGLRPSSGSLFHFSIVFRNLCSLNSDMPFFVVPDIKYEFSHPEGTGKGALTWQRHGSECFDFVIST